MAPKLLGIYPRQLAQPGTAKPVSPVEQGDFAAAVQEKLALSKKLNWT
jgi:hypothetical protein